MVSTSPWSDGSSASDGPAGRLHAYYEGLTPEGLGKLSEFYAEDAYFKDPFNEVNSLQAIKEIFARMYVVMDEPRFKVRGQVGVAPEVFLLWDLEFRFKGRAAQQCIHGVSHLLFDAEGRVRYHRDYWDSAEELYCKIPILGAFMRWLRHRVG